MHRRRSGIRIMTQLMGLVKPLLPIAAAAVGLGVFGYLCAIFLTIFAGAAILMASGYPLPGGFPGSLTHIYFFLAVFAVLRGVLHYGEQECNHYMAFKLLADIRHRVFQALRRLCPAKLEGRDRGNLISVITSDIELLEVFYAHTITPICIAFLTSIFMVFFIGSFHPVCGLVALAGYGTVGIIIPLCNSRKGADAGMEYREEFGRMNSFILDSLRGLRETIQYGQGSARLYLLQEGTGRLSKSQRRLKELEGTSSAVTGAFITLFSFLMLFLALWLQQNKAIGFDGTVVVTLAMMGSFGPVTALSSLSNNLNQTLACGERVLSILEEEPQVQEVLKKPQTRFGDSALEHVTFAYDQKVILNDVSMKIPENHIIGIHGKSGCGKSTLLKLLMRFWDVKEGKVLISDRDVREINTSDLREMESFVTQDTVLFHDTIANNISIGSPGASREDIIKAAKKASVHEFIEKTPNGYDTSVGELGDRLSGGERQRIGIARAFLHDAPLLLLDEPTSNLDSLNEGIILKSLKEEKKDRTVILVSHRKSTMNLAETVYQMAEGRIGAKLIGKKEDGGESM